LSSTNKNLSIIRLLINFNNKFCHISQSLIILRLYLILKYACKFFTLVTIASRSFLSYSTLCFIRTDRPGPRHAELRLHFRLYSSSPLAHSLLYCTPSSFPFSLHFFSPPFFFLPLSLSLSFFLFLFYLVCSLSR